MRNPLARPLLLAIAATFSFATLASSKSKSQNVFGWQDHSHRRPHQQSIPTKHYYESLSTTKASPLKRSQNFFNWQHTNQVIHTSSKSSSEPPPNKANNNNNHPLNNLKLQPRKKELWLPWPLGELRSDYHRFAQQHRHHPANENKFMKQTKTWANNLISRTKSFNKSSSSVPQAERYWVKDTTTPMATASASIGGKKRTQDLLADDGEVSKKKMDHEMIFRYVKLQMKVRLRQLGYVASDFSIHLPPSTPTLLLFTLLPTDPIRRILKASLTGATLSWIHSEATKYRRFAPLPIMREVNLRRPDLLPFLPDALSDEGSVILTEDGGRRKQDNSTNTVFWDPFQSFGTISSAYRSWVEGQSIRGRRMHEERRREVQDKLLEMGDLNCNSTENSYALITGASRGIGRALAIELARYRIPLILVARDISKLTTVASDIEKYYQIPCRVIQADLSSSDCASRIHAATTEAGLNVDILINNAGVCSQGAMVEGDEEDVMDIIRVNVGSVVRLSRLYGRDMKERRRGRMLFVSSMTGAMPGCATVAVYAASKAFEKSFAASLGRELERFGVGVTCLLPGAVKETDFASRTDVESAVCFQIPGYAKSPELVAGEGIKAMMLGYPEVYPGWENKLFAKLTIPYLPLRISSLIGEYAWSPWPLGMLPKNKIEKVEEATTTTSVSSHNTWKFRRPSIVQPGNILRLPELPKLQMPKARSDELPKLQMPKTKSDEVVLSDVKDGVKLNETDVDVTSSGNKKVEISELVDNNPSETSPASPDTPKQTILLSIEEEPQPGVDGINSGEVESVVPDENVTWYPSMLDTKQYDFRDRRLDY